MSEQEQTPQLGRAPCMVNGRTTSKTYLVVAVKQTENGYNAAGIRKLGDNEFKWHFWPRANDFHVVEHDKVRHKLYSRPAGRSVCAYEGVVTNKADTEILLDYLKCQPDLLTAPREQIFDALNGKLRNVTFNESTPPRTREAAKLFPFDYAKTA